MESSLMATDIIPPSEIQTELTRLWENSEGTNKTRASLFNLIFYTKKKARIEYIRAIAKKVVEKFPSRIIFITIDTESAKSYLNTRVSMLSIPHGDIEVACDLIEIEAAGTHQERLPFVILPHIFPDLPIYVIWGEDPLEKSSLLDQLKGLATRMIFDSEATKNLPQFAENILRLKTSIADLNWARMESWRDLITSTFYLPERLDQLKKASKIHIIYNAEQTEFYWHTQIQSIYMQAWLATQLGWTLESIKTEKSILYFTYLRKDGKVEVKIYPEYHKNMKSGTIVSVDIETSSPSFFSFGRNLQLPSQVSMRFSNPTKCELPANYIFGKDESGASLVKEICHKESSQHFLNLLTKIKEIKELSFCEF